MDVRRAAGEDLTAGGWSNVVGQVSVPGAGGGSQTMQDTNAATRTFNSVNVTVEP